MIHHPLFWIVLTFLFMFIESVYTSFEMALVSFNKIRLQYYVSQGDKRAQWANQLLHSPSRLFGTTLLMVNISLQMGSECSRQFYSSLGLDPAIAPLTQVPLILIFSELAPMFAARRYSEQVTMLGIKILYITSKIMAPLTWAIGVISGWANRLIGGPGGMHPHIFLSREELQHMVEEHDEGIGLNAEDEALNLLVSNMFTFQSKAAREAMVPLNGVAMLPSNATVGAMRALFTTNDATLMPIFYHARHNIIAIAYPRDLVKVPDNQRVRDHAKAPWFIVHSTPLLQILKQFRRNKESVAVVLDDNGQAVGILTLDDLLEEIFGERPAVRPGKRRRFVERTIPAGMTIAEFNHFFETSLEEKPETVGELLIEHVGHPPEKGESVRIGNFEFTAVEATLLGAKTVLVKTLR